MSHDQALTITPFEWRKTAWVKVGIIFTLLWIPALILLLEHDLDNIIQIGFNSARDVDWLAKSFQIYSQYGVFIVFGCILIIVALSFKNPVIKPEQRIFFVMFLTALFTLVAVLVLKEIIQRDRPFVELGNQINSVYFPSGFSFPSNHSGTTFGLVLPFVFFLGKGRIRYLVRGFFFIFAALVAFSRVFLGVHYLSDIFAGAGLAFLMLGFATTISNHLFLTGKINPINLEKILKVFAVMGLIIAPILFIFE